MIGRCLNCPVVFINAEAFAAHSIAHNSASVAPSALAAPFPTTHGMRSVERGNIASRATVTGNRTGAQLPARMMHPSARLAAIPGGAA